MGSNNNRIDDWQSLVNKPAYASDGKEIGIVSAIEPEKLVISYGPITPDKYLIPKSSIKTFDNGIVYLNETSEFITRNYKFE